LWFLAPLILFMTVVTLLTAEDKLAERLAETLWKGLGITAINLSIVTIIFAFIDRMAPSSKDSEGDWHPRDLPELPELDPRVQRSEAVGSLISTTALLFWWLGLNRVFWGWFGWTELPFEWGVWNAVNSAVIALLITDVGRQVMGLVRPRWIKLYLETGWNLPLQNLLSSLTNDGRGNASLDKISGRIGIGSLFLWERDFPARALLTSR
jgi:hypothetical protein